MYLLYLDESGHPADPNQKYIILAGVALFERQAHWLDQQVSTIAARFNPAEPLSIELHGSPMRQGRDCWKGVSRQDRMDALRDSLDLIRNSHRSTRLFGVAIEKSALAGHADPLEDAFERLCRAFDVFLMRQHRQGNSQRGLIVVDKTSYETTFQSLTRRFKEDGHRWGVIRNLVEVPMCLDSKASRLVQLADLVAYSCFRHFEKGDSELFSIIQDKFDEVSGVKHGLIHIPVLAHENSSAVLGNR